MAHIKMIAEDGATGKGSRNIKTHKTSINFI